MTEKRKVERFELSLPVRVTVDNTVYDEFFTEDISSLGMFIQTDKPFLLGSKVDVSVLVPIGSEQIPDRKSLLSVTGKVIRAERMGMAVLFDKQCKIKAFSNGYSH